MRKLRPNERCEYCGLEATTLDHVVPKSKGGSNHRSNLVPCCHPCNQGKADMSLEAWIAAGKPRANVPNSKPQQQPQHRHVRSLGEALSMPDWQWRRNRKGFPDP
jgi:HNH endonuclease